MKASTKAIIILSAALSAAAGGLVYCWTSGEKTKEDLRQANARIKDAGALNRAVVANNVMLTERNEKKDTLIAAAAGEISALKATVERQASEQGKAHELSAVAVADGASLQEAFDAGKTIVEESGIAPLIDWYRLVGNKIAIVIEDNVRLDFQVAVLEPLNMQLRDIIVSLTADVEQVSGLEREDAATLAEQRGSLAAQDIDLAAADQHITAALGRAQAGELAAWILAALLAIVTIDDVGHRAGVW